MTTIILVAIGVLIAAAAALAVIYYGGDAFGVNKTRAEAARLVSEGAQIQYATDLFVRQEGTLPGDGVSEQALPDLLSKKYLQSVPVGVVNADGTRQPWTMEYSATGMIYSRVGLQSDEAAMAVCREARRQLKYTDTVQSGPDAGKLMVYRCDGTDYRDASWRSTGTIPDREPCCIR